MLHRVPHHVHTRPPPQCLLPWVSSAAGQTVPARVPLRGRLVAGGTCCTVGPFSHEGYPAVQLMPTKRTAADSATVCSFVPGSPSVSQERESCPSALTEFGYVSGKAPWPWLGTDPDTVFVSCPPAPRARTSTVWPPTCPRVPQPYFWIPSRISTSYCFWSPMKSCLCRYGPSLHAC